jgi:hypothetical protein
MLGIAREISVTANSSTPRDKNVVFSECDKMGEAAVLADLERIGRFNPQVEDLRSSPWTPNTLLID